MLRTNCKEAKNNLRAYVVKNFTGDNYAPKYDYITTAEELGKPADTIFSMVAWAVWTEFHREKDGDNRRISNQELFVEWLGGLPSVGIGDFWCGDAKADLKAILKETDEEADRFTESEAEEMLSRLIFREVYGIVSRANV